ncbi:MAG: thiamine pyrophosphate-dependent enzyme, partial [Desulfitobacteriaceae bacterium]|nr:thiamine pyrophosphate-dependent enzyme [Desulfitobacteriaceae bacterium]
DDRVTGLLEQFAPKAKVVHFDIDAAEINKNVRTDIRVLGHLKWSLSKLVDISRDKFDCEAMQEQMRPWLGQLNEWRSENPLSYEARAGQVMPQAVIEIVDELTQGDAVIVTDVGQNQMWAAQFYHFKNPRSWLTSGGLGTMGYGLPAGLGAQVGCPNKKVVVITGDGGLMMNCQELDTVAKFNLPVKIMVLNNQVLGMVAQWQRMFYGGRYAHTNMEGRTDLVKLAEAMGVPGMRVTQPDEVRRTLQEALAMPGPVLVDFRIPSDEDVMPMVPGGARLDQMVMGGK